MTPFEENFCGSEFMNITLLWDTDHPDFTNCFHKTVFSWTPGLILLVVSALEIGSYLSSASRKIPWNVYNLTKVVATFVIIAINVTEFILTCINAGDEDPDIKIYPVDYVSDTVFFLASSWSLVLLLLSLHYGIRTSAAQFLYFFASVVCGGASFRTIVRKDVGAFPTNSMERTKRLLILFSIQYSMIILLFILNLFSDAKPKQIDPRLKNLTNPCPKIAASFFSKITFGWVAPLMWKGFRNPLEPSQLWQVDPKMASREIVPLFDSTFLPKFDKARNKKAILERNEVTKSSEIEMKRLDKDEKKKKKAKPAPGTYVSIFPALVKTFGPSFFAGSALKVIYDCMAMVAPQIMKLMIDYVDTKVMLNDDNQQKWKGYFYGGLLLSATVFQSIILSQYFERMYVVAMNVRTALISTIYRKSLRMSNTAKKESTQGQIVNLMSVDVQRFMVSNIP